MAEFIVKTNWEGYSRGVAEWVVEADSEEEAREIYYEGQLLSKMTIRDDTTDEIKSVEKLEE